ncbi:two-partner secretion domain-containing protein [Baaleninema simplex]|uniref:two-partner secretion domain-containing protein n=1 Tax=Baaleninema simplex TaxID=2862350 RepID=UPI00034B58C6|nr:filamentous hemagglutinin N-terminal domain-containing protein [Baaleninema simplex]
MLLNVTLNVTPAVGQIVPDGTLPNPSQVSNEGNTFTLDGGTEAGSNLFHSFQDFSVPTGSEAFFNNATNIENILTRVTGGNISNIDGLLRANGTANLFLINPNGIVFGPNARLDVGGSFFSSTANSIVFENGLEFSATSPETQPLLTVSVPMGLQFNGQGGDVRFRGNGYSFQLSSPRAEPVLEYPNVLQVNPGQTLAFVGGNVLLDGAALTSAGGRIELGGVGEGLVRLETLPDSHSWNLNYEGVSDFGDVNLVGQSAVDVSGSGVGSMQFVGRQITLDNGSNAILENSGTQSFGAMRVQAEELLALTGATPDGRVVSGIRQRTLGVGDTGDINIATGELVLRDGAQILNRSSPGLANTGNINVRASGLVELDGFALANPALTSTIVIRNLSTGSNGNVTISARNIILRGGARLGTTTVSSSAAGDVLVNVTETIEVAGVEPRTFRQSQVGSVSLSSGPTGNLTINTSRAIVGDGGSITTSTLGDGDSGRVIINATEFVEVSGSTFGSEGIIPSRIEAIARQEDEAGRQFFGLPEFPTGSSGNLEINTPQLNVFNGGEVTARNEGLGRAGSLLVNAEAVFLDEGGGITASTRSGEGGDISLRVNDSLQLRHGSEISAEAGGSGNGGNLAISADTIALLEGSRINANAFEGSGGNIEIATRGLFASSDSRITASSQLGVDGIVAVTQPEIDTSSALVQLSSAPIDPTTQIVSACSAARENSFVVTGNGGLPPNPLEPLQNQAVWVDWPDRSEITRLSEVDERTREDTPTEVLDSDLVEANGWKIDGNGNAELVSSQSRNASFMPLECLSER